METTICCSGQDISMMLGGDSDEVRRRNRRWTKISCFFHVIIGILSNGSDCFFYVELNATEKGLVYGPVNEKVLIALLVFCVVGCLIFLADLSCHVYSHCSCLKKWEKRINNPHLISILAVLFGDIPQVLIRICVARCREQGLSYFQIAKTTLVFLGGLIRIFIFICAHRKDKIHKSFKYCMIAGLLIHFSLMIWACIVGFADQKSPSSTIEEQYNDKKYLNNVGVFFQHPRNNSPNSWISVMSIYDIYNQPNVSLLYIYRYEETTTHWTFAIRTKFQKGLNLTEGSPECYRMELTTGNISTVNMSDCWNSLFSQPTSLHIKFTYTPPESVFHIIRKKLFGDIVYNMKVTKNNSCLTHDMFVASGDSDAKPTFGYFRVNANVRNFTGPHLLLDNGQPRFYHSQSDLQDISEVWRTGAGSCETSGTRAPTFDSNMEVDCSK
ncbi:uncharacterized protein LOC112561586 [Pomacea canaliculata]|uniref:uncharacterized protein LOC112561586 n=1 Tax=Pomacea canaliculata TaxID=400727 RepID=UPI000D736082|nr:uncharacterized protein LOC112561586 [Pomacea canaliculata]